MPNARWRPSLTPHPPVTLIPKLDYARPFVIEAGGALSLPGGGLRAVMVMLWVFEGIYIDLLLEI